MVLSFGMAFSIWVRRLVGYFGFRDYVDHWLSSFQRCCFHKRKRMVLSRQGVKSNMVIFRLMYFTFGYVGHLYLAEDWGFQFYDAICTERQFIVFGIVLDILDWRRRLNLARDHRNTKALFFFFTDISHCM